MEEAYTNKGIQTYFGKYYPVYYGRNLTIVFFHFLKSPKKLHSLNSSKKCPDNDLPPNLKKFSR